MPELYIVAGCNGAGKTTASYSILPEILDCKEFINADEIARGISPFQADKVAFQSGRIMLDRINELLIQKENFAFETTLATKSFLGYVKKARKEGYETTLLFFWLESVELAIKRVSIRVDEGGHDIPVDVIRRRYERGIKNLFNRYMGEVNKWIIVDNSGNEYTVIAQGDNKSQNIYNNIVFEKIKEQAHG